MRILELDIKQGDLIVMEFEDGAESFFQASFPMNQLMLPKECITLVRNSTVLYYRANAIN